MQGFKPDFKVHIIHLIEIDFMQLIINPSNGCSMKLKNLQ